MLNRRTVLATGIGVISTMTAGQKVAAAPSAAAAGFFYPDEADPHLRTFMQWPVNREIHTSAEFLSDLQQSIADIANTIVAFEPVVLLMDKSHVQSARKRLSSAVEVWEIPTDDLWCRDSGPSFVIDGKGGLAMTQFNFNGWGNKQRHTNDGLVAPRLAERLGLQSFNNGIIGEAGGFEVDGAGTLIAHESSWVNPNRNSGSKKQVERLLLEALGAKKIIWAPGIKGADITDYHIDALARFIEPGHVLIQMGIKVDHADPWSRAAHETHRILASATDAMGRPMRLTVIPEPVEIRVDTADFVSSYVNYYVCNGAVIAAEFGDKGTDEKAATLLAKLYPGRKIVMLNVDPLGEAGGGIHCATHEQPKV